MSPWGGISSKKNSKHVIGPEGLKRTLEVLSDKGHGHVPTVAIGGINASNTPQVMFRGSSPRNPLGGVAVVSAIMAARDPEAASRQLLGLVRHSFALRQQPRSGPSAAATKEDMLRLVPGAIKAVHDQKPLSHNMTNLVCSLVSHTMRTELTTNTPPPGRSFRILRQTSPSPLEPRR